MSLHSEYVNANCGPEDWEPPVPVCSNCGVLTNSQFEQRGERYGTQGDGPYPVYVCLRCGSGVDFE